MTLTFIVVLAYFMSTDSYKSYFGVSSLSIGAAYSACSFVSVSINWKINKCSNSFREKKNQEKPWYKKCTRRMMNKKKIVTKTNQTESIGRKGEEKKENEWREEEKNDKQ